MSINYEVISEDNLISIKPLCNDLMLYQKSKASIHPEFFDSMCFETRMVPTVKESKANYIAVARDEDEIVGYAYSTVAPKTTYSDGFATLYCEAFFDFNSVKNEDVGSLSQFYIRPGYRNRGIGSVLYNMSMDWLRGFDSIDDIFIFVSNGNDNALKFYLDKGFNVSHKILDGFMTVLRN